MPALRTHAAAALARHWPVLPLVLAGALLVLPGLGRDYLWEDEGDTAVLARGILARGVPAAWDGVTLAVPDFGKRLTDDFVMVSHPWLQYYLAAASFALLGETPFAARLPFALAGIATVVVLYLMTMALVRNRRAAVTSAMLLLASVQFLLYARQARNYTIHALLTCLVVWQFFRLERPWQAVLFTLLGILLFHAHPAGLVVLVVLGVMTVASPRLRARGRLFWPAAATVAAYCVPWLVASTAGYSENSSYLPEAGLIVARLLQFAVECASVTPLVGIAALLVALALRARRARNAARAESLTRRKAKRRRDATATAAGMFEPEERAFLAVSAALGVGYAATMAATQSRDVMWIVGVRYVPAVIPFSLAVAGMLIAKLAQRSTRLWIVLLVVFALTNLGKITPLVLWQEPAALRATDAMVGFHVPKRAVEGIVRTTQARYVFSLLDTPHGVIAGISRFLLAHAGAGDIVITNYAWEAVYFHTRLPQAMKVNASFPIYETVRQRLPEYVYTPRGVRWIVWRRAWAPYWAQDCERIVRELTAAGIPVRLVASIPETLYENRENVHFRRFAGGDYVYPWFDDLPPTLIYRVDWPEAPGTGSQ